MKRTNAWTAAVVTLLTVLWWQAPAAAQKESLATVELELKDLMIP
jgi:hypothetical protein